MTDRSPSNPLQPNSPESNQQSIGSRETIAPSGLDLDPKNSGPFPSLPVRFGRFEVRKHLGKGAMGTVYLAFDPELNKPEINNQVAIKIPLLQTNDDSTLLERFCREAQATGAMNHPNICGMYEVGEINGTHYISMEYIDGRQLAEYIGAGQEPQLPRQVAGIIRKLAEGLAHAHERGFIHRDLKPTNVMIATNGQPKIMDFGLARRFGVTGDIRLTQSNTIVGSPAYMSPEQARSENDTLTPASDIYSLGTLFFELLTCELPFRGPLAVVLGMVALNRVPKPSSIRPDVDPRLEVLCLKMLEKKVESRPKSMTEVADSLAEWLRPAASKSNPVMTLVEEPVALTPKKIAAPSAAKTDGIENQKRRVTDLLDKHEYGAAISHLEKMTNLNDARFAPLIAWAKPKLKEVRATEQQRRESSAPSCATAEQLLKHYDYAGAVALLTAVPSAYRSLELRDLLSKATELHDECEHLQRSIEEAIRDGDKDALPGLVKGLLKLKPNNKAIKQLAAEVKELGAAKVIARRKGQRQTFDPAGRVVEPQHIALSIVLVVGLFVGVSLMVRNYLATSQPPKPVLTPDLIQPKPVPPMLGQSSANDELLKRAPADVVAFEKKLFKAFPEQLTWQEATKKCQEMGGRLAQVNSQAENDFLVKLAVERKLAAIWLGATDEVEERTWLWSNGAGLAFNYFANGQPDRSRSGKRYLVMMLKSQVGRWCNQPSQSDDWSPGFVCEWNAPAVANEPLPQTITSQSTGLKLALIRAGTFQMGSPAEEAMRSSDEGPQHTVRISQPFYMGVYEVTQAEYESVMGTNPSGFSKTGSDSSRVSGQDTSQFPVENVSRYDALEFCNTLSAKDGLAPYYALTNAQRENGSIKSASVSVSGGQGYRLPTEAEWEYACRSDTTTPFHFGGVLNGDQANVNGNIPYGTPTKGKSLGRTTPVGSYSSNAFGLYDMHGNVWEWCEDLYDDKAYANRTGITTDPVVKNGSNRVLRGGSWYRDAWGTRAAVRVRFTPGDRVYNFGFRVVSVGVRKNEWNAPAVANKPPPTVPLVPKPTTLNPTKQLANERVFQEDFKDPKKSQLRSQSQDNLSQGYENGHYFIRLQPGKASYGGVTFPPKFNDFDAVFTVRANATGAANVSVMFREERRSEDQTVRHIWFVNYSGNSCVVENTFDATGQSKERFILNWTDIVLPRTEWLQLRVRAVGARAELYVNNQLFRTVPVSVQKASPITVGLNKFGESVRATLEISEAKIEQLNAP